MYGYYGLIEELTSAAPSTVNFSARVVGVAQVHAVAGAKASTAAQTAGFGKSAAAGKGAASFIARVQGSGVARAAGNGVISLAAWTKGQAASRLPASALLDVAAAVGGAGSSRALPGGVGSVSGRLNGQGQGRALGVGFARVSAYVATAGKVTAVLAIPINLTARMFGKMSGWSTGPTVTAQATAFMRGAGQQAAQPSGKVGFVGATKGGGKANAEFTMIVRLVAALTGMGKSVGQAAIVGATRRIYVQGTLPALQCVTTVDVEDTAYSGDPPDQITSELTLAE